MSLRDFFDAFTSSKWSTNNVIGELGLEDRIAALPDERKGEHRARLAEVTDTSLREAVRLFSSGELQALIIIPEGSDRRVISQRAWNEAFFPERLFLDSAIASGHGGELEAAVGRTPFVSTESARGYLKASKEKKAETPASMALRDLLIGLVMDGVARPAEAEDFGRRWGLRAMQERPPADQYDPMKSVAWTLPMALSWMVFRDPYSVREAMDEYRANWWVWVGCHRRLPVRGGTEWFEVQGAELRTLEPLTMFKMSMREAAERGDEHGNVAMSVKDARELMWTKLAEGTLVATAIDREGAVVQIPAHEWPYLALESDDNLMDRLVRANGQHVTAYEKVTVRQTDVIGLWQGHSEPPSPPMMAMLVNDPSWTFLEAATWVGTGGRDLPSKQVADEDLEEKGAYALFRALFPERGLVATGLTEKRLREPIPAEYWEMATMDPDEFRERHYVSFIDDVLGGYGGQLTPVGEDGPRWFGIRLDRDSVFSAFPELAPKDGPMSLTASVTNRTPIRNGDRLEATCRALRELFPRGLPKGLAAKDRLKRINDWHDVQGSSRVSGSTVLRAIRTVFDDPG